MRAVFEALDALREAGVIQDYVIGGATALLYYSQPAFTEDIDVFVWLESDSPLADLGPVYTFLKEKGAVESDEYLMIEGFPIQILLPYDDLSIEGFEHPNSVHILSREVKILALEYLMAIMIQLGKSKYRERLRVLLTENLFDESRLNDILLRHGLTEKWNRLRSQLI